MRPLAYRFVGLNDRIAGKVFPLVPGLILGGERGVDIVHADRSQANSFGRVDVSPAGYYLITACGAASITVNGKTTRCHQVTDGDVVCLGQLSLRVEQVGQNSSPVWEVDDKEDEPTPRSEVEETKPAIFLVCRLRSPVSSRTNSESATDRKKLIKQFCRDLKQTGAHLLSVHSQYFECCWPLLKGSAKHNSSLWEQIVGWTLDLKRRTFLSADNRIDWQSTIAIAEGECVLSPNDQDMPRVMGPGIDAAKLSALLSPMGGTWLTQRPIIPSTVILRQARVDGMIREEVMGQWETGPRGRRARLACQLSFDAEGASFPCLLTSIRSGQQENTTEVVVRTKSIENLPTEILLLGERGNVVAATPSVWGLESQRAFRLSVTLDAPITRLLSSLGIADDRGRDQLQAA